MSSRPPLGVQRLSGPALSQRAASHPRALSQQQYPPPPPPAARKDVALYDFSPVDSADGPPPGRLVAQRRGGSRLKLELSHDSSDSAQHVGATQSPSAVESSKAFTPSRIMPPTDSSDLGDMSPHLSVHMPSIDTDAPLPMPRRPPPFVASLPRREMPPPATSANPPKKDPRPKPYSVEPPAAAPRYSTYADVQRRAAGAPPPPAAARGYADFFPWSGNHPEDHFSENVIRNGYYDKGQFSTAETQSAKGVLFPALKHKTGLTALSSIFTAVLGQRRHNGQITAPSTFKPPPRVTLTDTKREAWLRDLANPSISLRRLSRTIPHGIRGKVLLEQCLNKNVPTDRAVWLIKCVGANEIRATKRKGVSTLVMGGETRWIKDWTVSVEQFIEHVYFSFDEEDWKAKVHYTTRLAAHLYAEHLLDREHYSEWLVSNLENSSEAKLPMWMLLTQLYWKDLLKLRKYGRRLVTALTSHHHSIYTHPDKDILHPLLQNLTQCLNTLILSSPENFVSPSTWPKYRDSLQACLPAGDEARLDVFSAINSRNEQLAATANRSQPAARHILVRMLDGTLQTPMPTELPSQCWGISKDKDALAKALLEWCTSLYRPGLAKIYVTSRILQHWSTLGLDATRSVLDFLGADECQERGRKATFYHVVCELVRLGVFSVARYVQWLIPRGGLRNQEDVLPDGPAPTRLLAEIPWHALGASQRSLRSGMLRRASFSVADEEQDAELAIKHLRHSLGMPTDAADPMLQRRPLSIAKLSKKIRSASRALKAEIGSWLRSSFAAHAEEKEKEESQAPDISPSIFYAVRSVLEAAEDFYMLGDVLKTLTKHSGIEVLAAIADTVSRHFFVFSALGDSVPLFRSLHQRLRAAVREQVIVVRPLLASLATLAPRIPGMEDLALQLKRDLALSDRQNPVDVCSPVSDNMIARLQDDAAELHEEIEKLLAGGSSLDRNTMERLFQTVTQRLQACWGKAQDKQRAYSSLLGRLRVFDPQHFDGLMVKWLLYLRTLGNRPSILQIFPLLVSVGCLDMCAILATASDFSVGQGGAGGGGAAARTPTVAPGTPQVVQLTYRTRYMQEVLQLLTTPLAQNDLMTPDEVYRFAILQDQAIRDGPKEVLNLIFLASAEYSYAKSQNDLEALPLDSDAVLDRLLDLLKRLVLRDPAGVARALGVRSTNPHVGAFIDDMTTRLLIPTTTATGAPNQTNPATTPVTITFDKVLELTNEFTLPFCQVKLVLSLNASSNSGEQGVGEAQSHVDLFASAMDKAVARGNVSWVGMLGCLSPEITQHLRARAQARLLEMMPSLRGPVAGEGDGVGGRGGGGGLQMAENLLAVIEAIMRGGGASGLSAGPAAAGGGGGGGARQVAPLAPAIVDRLVDLWEILAAPDEDDHNSNNTLDQSFAVPTSSVAAKTAVLTQWLPLALNLVTLHAHAAAQESPASKQSSDIRARLLLVCAGLLQELDALVLLPWAKPTTMTTTTTPSSPQDAVMGGCEEGLEGAATAAATASSPTTNTTTTTAAAPATTTAAQQQQQAATVAHAASAAAAQAAAETTQRLARRVFDLCCLLADHLPDEARAMCVRAVREAAGGDARVRYIFSFGAGTCTVGGGSGGEGGGGDGAGPASSASASVGGALMFAQRGDGKGGAIGGGGGGGVGGARSAGAAAAAAAAAAGVNTLFSGLLGTPSALWGVDRGLGSERLSVFQYRRWETLSEPTPNVGENDTALSLGLFEARRVQ